MYDIAIVGAGFAGAVLAERFASQGRRVLIVEARAHVAGNAYDYYEEHGVLVHKYGPHIFHTNDAGIVHYLSRFTQWRHYEHRVLASVEGQLIPIPINATSMTMLYGRTFSSSDMEAHLAAVRVPISHPENAEESVLARMGRDLYEKCFRGYTQKQWGRSPKDLHASVTARIPIRVNYDDRYFTDKYQLMPARGYTRMFHNMLTHPNITILQQTTWEEIEKTLTFNKLIFTGPVDSFFGYMYGKLPYRSLEFVFEFHNQEIVQPTGTINFPNDHSYTRITEFKHITGQRHAGSVTVTEYPRAEGDPYYPVPADDTEEVLKKYREEGRKLKTVRFVGRLGSYRYYNMDQVVASALHLFDELNKEGW